MAFLSIMGKIIIVISVIALPLAIIFIVVFADTLGGTLIAELVAASVLFFLVGLYFGMLGIRIDGLHEKIDYLTDLTNPQSHLGKARNLIKAVCPIDNREAIFVHISPHRDDALPDGLDLFLGSCGHEVQRRQIKVEQ